MMIMEINNIVELCTARESVHFKKICRYILDNQFSSCILLKNNFITKLGVNQPTYLPNGDCCHHKGKK